MARPDIPLPTVTYAPPNRASASDTPEHLEFIAANLEKEEKLGRMSEPFPADVIAETFGHFRSSPLGVVDKATPPGAKQKYRQINDASDRDAFGISVNSLIDSDAFPTQWDGPLQVALLVSVAIAIYTFPPHLPRTTPSSTSYHYPSRAMCGPMLSPCRRGQMIIRRSQGGRELTVVQAAAATSNPASSGAYTTNPRTGC